MQTDVEKGKEAQHPPEFNQPLQARELAQRRYAERYQQKNQCPLASGSCDDLDRIGTQIIRSGAPYQMAQRDKAKEKNDGFDPSEILQSISESN